MGGSSCSSLCSASSLSFPSIILFLEVILELSEDNVLGVNPLERGLEGLRDGNVTLVLLVGADPTVDSFLFSDGVLARPLKRRVLTVPVTPLLECCSGITVFRGLSNNSINFQIILLNINVLIICLKCLILYVITVITYTFHLIKSCWFNQFFSSNLLTE